MFNGPFEMTVQNAGVKELKNKLEEFFANWVFNWDFDKMDVTKMIDGWFNFQGHTNRLTFYS